MKTKNYVGILENAAKHLFGSVEYEIFFTLKFHALNYVTDGLGRLRHIFVFQASPFEHFSWVRKQFIRSISGRHCTAMGETDKTFFSSGSRNEVQKERTGARSSQLS